MNPNQPCQSGGYGTPPSLSSSRLLRATWVAIGSAAVVLVPLRMIEIAFAHNPNVALCVASASDARPPTFAFSHADLNKGNLKDE